MVNWRQGAGRAWCSRVLSPQLLIKHIFTLTLFFLKIIQLLRVGVEIKLYQIEIYTSDRLTTDMAHFSTFVLSPCLWQCDCEVPPQSGSGIYFSTFEFGLDWDFIIYLGQWKWQKWQCAFPCLGAFLLLAVGILAIWTDPGGLSRVGEDMERDLIYSSQALPRSITIAEPLIY